MDDARYKLCGRAMFIASCKGYLASFDEDGDKMRFVLVAPDGHRVVGEFLDTKELAIESCALKFLQTDHDTKAGTGDN
jgi:hypothetical protein